MANDVYDDLPASGRPERVAISCQPAVIGSPRLSGKTTLLNVIRDRHRRLAAKSQFHYICIDLPRGGEQAISETALRTRLSEALEGPGDGSLTDILDESRVVQRSGRKLIAFVNSESLEESALKWLLSGFKNLEGRPITTRRTVQVVIDGSFSVDTLTRGPNSDFPLAQVVPPEFGRHRQRDFMARRLSELNIRMTESAHETLWQSTLGDKYLSQVVGAACVERRGLSGRAVSGSDVESIVKQSSRWGRLCGEASRAIAALATVSVTHGLNPKQALHDIWHRWSETSVALRSLAYDGGLVRRMPGGDIVARAPGLIEPLNSMAARVSKIVAHLLATFSLEAVPEAHRQSASVAVDEILLLAAQDNLTEFQIGHGTMISVSEARVETDSVSGARYSAVWSVPILARPGSRVWVLFWMADTVCGRQTQLRVYPVASWAPES